MERNRTQTPASSSPTETGASPFRTARPKRPTSPALRLDTRVATKVSSAGGTITAVVAAIAPSQPATCQPTSVTNNMFGPGAACAIEYAAANCSVVIQRWTSTT